MAFVCGPRREADRASKTEEKKGTEKPKKKKKKKEKEAEPRASTTDTNARVMKMADGGFRPAYNVQFASDTVSGAIAGVSVDNIGSDKGKMAPMNDKLAKDYGQRPKEHLADGGYNKLKDVEVLTEAGVTVYMPLNQPRDKGRDPYTPKSSDSPAVAAWRKRMGTEEAKEIYKERAATAECNNAQARYRGLTQFVVRNLKKVKNCALWQGLTHNMVCTWRLLPA